MTIQRAMIGRNGLSYAETFQENRFQVIGIDFGYKGIWFKETIPDTNFEIWKSPGCEYWSGIGMQKYGATNYYLVEIVERAKDLKRGRVKFILKGEFERQWYAGLRELRRKAQEINDNKTNDND